MTSGNAVKSFNTNFIIAVVMISNFHLVHARDDEMFSCAEDIKNFPMNPSLIPGQWYEVARFPPSEVPACVEVFVPHEPKENKGVKYVLHVNYINNANKQWKLSQDVLCFDWNNMTKNGVFEMSYGGNKFNLDVTFKLMDTDYTNYALVCGYSGIAPKISLLKLLTRMPEPDDNTRNVIDELFRKNYMEPLLEIMTWVEQSDKCNGAAATLPELTSFLLAAIYGISKVCAGMF